jgi:hypothetical protein
MNDSMKEKFYYEDKNIKIMACSFRATKMLLLYSLPGSCGLYYKQYLRPSITF